jgi:hypothetical protein
MKGRFGRQFEVRVNTVLMVYCYQFFILKMAAIFPCERHRRASAQSRPAGQREKVHT